jgi:trimethylamine--corrinoid protein Co-methyltransferase
MQTLLQVLSEEERAQVHERTLSLLATTGVRVDTARGREIFNSAGAEVDENTRIVRIPKTMVEEALRLAPKEFTLGARRPGWDLRMNTGDCALLIDGEATSVLDRVSGERRLSTFNDWRDATRLIDAIDEIGLYWSMVSWGDGEWTKPGLIKYWHHLFRNFSKHVQDSITDPEHVPWLLEVLQVLFGDQETIRREHPLSFLLCPQSPLMLGGPATDSCLALVGWNIPVAIMPMPLMGATAPASLISTIIQGNCEVLSTVCLIQAAAPDTPIIYAPALAVINPRTGLYSGGAIEQGLMNAAGIEMARFYGLPVEGSGIGSDHYVPGIQAAYERALNGLLPVLSWPDILVGAGLLGGSMVLSFEQLLLDVEMFCMFKRARRGIDTSNEKWLEAVIDRVGPGGNFLGERSTRDGVRSGEWHLSELGVHSSYESWEAAGKPSLLVEAQERVDEILRTHQPLPLDEDIERELGRIYKSAQKEK